MGVCGLSMWAFGANIENLQNPNLGKGYTIIPSIPSPPPPTLGYLGWGAQKQILRQGFKYKWFICEAIQELLEGRSVSKGDREGEGASAGDPIMPVRTCAAGAQAVWGALPVGLPGKIQDEYCFSLTMSPIICC